MSIHHALVGLLMVGAAGCAVDSQSTASVTFKKPTHPFSAKQVTEARQVLDRAPSPGKHWLTAVVLAQKDGNDPYSDWQVAVLNSRGAFLVLSENVNCDNTLDPGLLIQPGDLIAYSTAGDDTGVCPPKELRLLAKDVAP